MGADLIMAHWWTTKPKEIDWGAAREYVKKASLEDLDDAGFQDSELEDLRGEAHQAIDEGERLWSGEYTRHAGIYSLGPVTVLLCGGLSWGDDPSETYGLLSKAPSGALEAAGFFR